MRTEITINGSSAAGANYVPWTPAPCRIRLLEAGGLAGPVAVTLRNGDPSRGGQVVFYTAPGAAPLDVLQLDLPTDGSPADFFLGGKFGSPSTADKDASVEVTGTGGGGVVLSVTPLMVRVRKDANTLTDDERDRFISALATLNDRGMGPYSDFRGMHRVQAALNQAHGDAGFLPWHRAYLLDLERELQKIDPSVALHYWRFDAPAPRVFTRQFMGETLPPPPSVPGAPLPASAVRFSPTNPLRFWVTDNVPGILRSRRFNPATQGARNPSGPAISEQETLKIGVNQGSLYRDFVDMEGQPHGRAHTSFTGSISSAPTAPKDPLFFLLHSNVDRLWAKWQWVFRRFDTADAAAYEPVGRAGDHDPSRLGHFLEDTMWPWDQDMQPPRPPDAPGGTFAASALTSAPGPSPTVLQMIDFQGKLNRSRRLGFDYDDVPYEV